MLRTIAAIALLCLIVPAMAHDDAQWIADQRLKNEMGELCCGVSDCQREPHVATTAAGYVIRGKETVPYSRALPASPNGFWACRWGGQLKCLIVPPSGS